MRVIITGGTGLIGRALAADWAKDGNEVVVLTRNPQRARGLPRGARSEQWDGKTGAGWAQFADGADAIVNLAGESIGIPPVPWTAEKKRRILTSRVDAGRAVVDAIRRAKNKPRVVLQSSAVGYYGLPGDMALTEDLPAGKDFLAEVCAQWEASSQEVEALGVRRAVIRTGHFFSRAGGLLPLAAMPFHFFVGGPLGDGKPWWPWIHYRDAVRAMRFLIENENARGIFNLAAPNPVTNAEFARTLGRALRRPAFFSAPAFAFKLILGEMAGLTVLAGQRAIPQRLQVAGFKFEFEKLEDALRDLYH